MTRAAFILSGVLSLGAGAALADPPAATANPTPAAVSAAPAPGANLAPAKSTQANDDQKVVCKYQEVTGSRLEGHKVCMTKADWAAQSTSARDAMRNNRPIMPSSH